MKVFRLLLISWLLFCCAGCPEQTTNDDDDPPDAAIDDSPRWNQLQANGARTGAVATDGLRESPQILWEINDDSPSPFSGPVIGPKHETSFGVGNKIYRVLGPGPVSFDPPEGIDMVIGTTSAVQVIHPQTGQILNERTFNLGTFNTFAAVDEEGNVIVPDWGRIQEFTGGLEELIWRYDYGGLFNGFGDVPAGSVAFLPDGNILLPISSGKVILLGKDRGTFLDLLDLSLLNPPIEPDPRLAWAGLLLRNAAAVDGREIFLLVNGEIIRLQYDEQKEEINFYERARAFGFSSSTPTLDTAGKRLFIATFDPDRPADPPMLGCFTYETRPMQLRWSIETAVDFPDSGDSPTVTYLPDQGIVVVSSPYGHLTAYSEEDSGQPKQLWTTQDTLGPDVAACSASATEPDGTLYFVENFTKSLYALDGQTGSVLWSREIPAQSIKTPIPHEGRLYVDHNEGLIALE